MNIFNELGTFWIGTFWIYPNIPINYNSTIVVNGKSILISDYKILFTGILEKNHDTFSLKYIMENQQDENCLQKIKKIDGKIKSPILILGYISGVIQISLIASPEKGNIFRIWMIFKDIHFINFDEIKFKKISLSFNNIDSFIETENIEKNSQRMYEGVPLFDYCKDENIKSYGDLDKEKISYQLNLNYQSPNFEEVKLDRFKLKIAPNVQIDPRENPRKYCIIENFEILLKYHQEEDFIEIKKDINHLKKIFTFILEKTYLTELKGKLRNKDQYIEIYTPKLLEALDNRDNKSIEPLFKFEEINNPSLLFKNWFEKYKISKPFYDLYFTPIFSEIYVETEFLLFAQALEFYYRKGDESKQLKDILRELLNDLNCNKVNEILDNYISEYNEGKDSENEREEKIDKFVKVIVDNRNYYTHYNDKKNPAKNFHKQKRTMNCKGTFIYDLIDLAKELKCIIEICFMKELGLPKDKIEKITKENKRFRLDHYYHDNKYLF